MRRRKAAAIGALTGVVEPPAALLAFAAFELASGLLVYGLAFAAGAMIYVISHEIIPETHRGRNAGHATAGLIVGFLVMMFLDVALA